MSRISACFKQLKAAKKSALIPYIVCGDPGLEQTLAIMHALVEAGADILELGVPFSDPMAEGPVIQLAHERALRNNVSLKQIFKLVESFRKTNQQTPLVLMGYANPIEKMGYENFARQAQAAGVDGVLTVDFPYEEVAEFNAFLKQYNLDNIFLLTPTTSERRAKNICDYASGYLYYVSLKGVTGAGHLDIGDVASNHQRLSAYTDLPICVGFGIKDAQSALAISKFAPGVVIGSALINIINDSAQGDVLISVKKWLQEIRTALK